MKKIILTTLLCLSMILPCIACNGESGTSSKNIDVILIAGQSNAAGNGYLEDLPAEYKGKTYKKVLFYGEGHCGMPATLTNVTTTTGLGCTSNKFGVEVGIAEVYQQTKQKVAIIKCAFNGSSINKKNTDNGSWWTNFDDIEFAEPKCYEKFLTAVSNGISKLQDEGYTPKIKAVVWLQGESNYNDDSYLSDLKILRTQMSFDLMVDDLYFIAGEIGYSLYGENCFVNKAVREFSNDDYCDYVACGGYTLDTRPDNIYHWTGKNMVEIGKLFGEKLINL